MSGKSKAAGVALVIVFGILSLTLGTDFCAAANEGNPGTKESGAINSPKEDKKTESAGAAASNELSLSDILNLEVVSVSKRAEKALETPSALTVVTADEIRLLNFNTLQEILEYATGVSSVNADQNIFFTQTMRGNTQTTYNIDTLMLYNGVPIYSPYHGSFDLSWIPVSSIERVEIVKGATSVLYGNNAVNGLISIITKTHDQQNAKVRFGTYLTTHGEGSFIKSYGDLTVKLFSDATGTQGVRQILNDVKGNSTAYNNDVKLMSVAASLKYKEFQFDFLAGNRTLRDFKVTGFNYNYTTNTSKGIPILTPELNNEYVQAYNLNFVHPMSDMLTLHARSSYLNWALGKDLSSGYWRYASSLVSTDLETDFDFGPKAGLLAGISNNVMYGQRYQSQNAAYDVGGANLPQIDFAIYANGHYRVFDWLNFYGGARYYQALFNSVVTSNLSKRAGLVFDIGSDAFVKLLYGESFRVPTFQEKEASSASTVPNPSLKPEVGISYDLILSKVVTRNLQVDLDFFYSKIEDQILKVAVNAAGSATQPQNVGHGLYLGSDINFKYHFDSDFYGFGGYAYANGVLDGEVLPTTYFHMLNLGGSYGLNEHFILTASSKALSNWGAAPTYLLLNAGIGYRPTGRSGVEMNLKVDNILGVNVLLPEIASGNSKVPTVPSDTNGQKVYVTLSYNF